MANYFDNSHIDGKQLTPQQIADAIRHKKFGVDVREAMAQGLEYCMTQAQKVDTLETEVKNLDERVTKLEVLPDKVDTLETEVKNLDERVTKLEVLPDKVADIKQDIVDINIEITKLKNAVFGDGATAVHTISANEDNHSQIAEEVKLD